MGWPPVTTHFPLQPNCMIKQTIQIRGCRAHNGCQMEEQTPYQEKVLLIRGFWLHLMLLPYVIRTYSLIAECLSAHKAKHLTKDIPRQMHHCMLVQLVAAILDKPTVAVRAAWVVWCSPTHGGGRRCLGLLRPTPVLGWPWCLLRPTRCSSGIRVKQPILMRGNRRQSPARCHPWGIAITLGRGRLLQGGHHRGQIGAQILYVLLSHLTGPCTHRQITEVPFLLPTSTYNPQVAPTLIHQLDMPLQGMIHSPGVAIVLMNKWSWRGGSGNFTS